MGSSQAIFSAAVAKEARSRRFRSGVLNKRDIKRGAKRRRFPFVAPRFTVSQEAGAARGANLNQTEAAAMGTAR